MQNRIKKFSRVEKAFLSFHRIYSSRFSSEYHLYADTTFASANDLTKINAQIEEKKTELDDAKQEVNELIRSERLKEIADKKDLKLNNENIRTAE